MAKVRGPLGTALATLFSAVGLGLWLAPLGEPAPPRRKGVADLPDKTSSHLGRHMAQRDARVDPFVCEAAASVQVQ